MSCKRSAVVAFSIVLASIAVSLGNPAGPAFDLDWHTIDGGGGTAVVGNLELSGTIGQADAGVLIGGGFELIGGFWGFSGEVAIPPCPWDCGGDNDNNVGIVDFLAVLAQWELVGSSCDFGKGPPGVGVEDFLQLLANWGPCP